MAKSRDEHDERYRRREKRERLYRDQLPGDNEEELPPPVEPIRGDAKPERNALCPCGSGKKYKKCCAKRAG